MTLSWVTYIWYSMLVNLSISTLLMTQIGWISAKVEHVELITKPKLLFEHCNTSCDLSVLNIYKSGLR